MEFAGVFFAVCIAIEAAILRWSIRKFGVLPCPSVLLMMIIGYQSVLILIEQDYITYPFLSTFTNGGISTNLFPALFTYAFIAIFICACCLGKNRDNSDARAGLQTRINIAPAVLIMANVFGLMILAILCAIFAASIDWSVAIENTRYLAMTNPNIILLPDSLRTVVLFPILVSTIAAVLCAINWERKLRVWSFLFGALCVLATLYPLGAHSRAAAAGPLVFLITSNVIFKRKNWFVNLIVVVMVAYALWSALVGRSAGTHGLVTIVSPSLVPDGSFSVFDIMIANFFEGILSFSESLSLQATFPVDYMILSFLPTPSIIDGFDQIVDLYQIRLSQYVPMSGLVEVYRFGPAYVLALLAIVFTAIRINYYNRARSRILFLFGNILILFGFYIMNTYPLRNAMRWIWLSILISLVGIILTRKNTFRRASRLFVRNSPVVK